MHLHNLSPYFSQCIANVLGRPVLLSEQGDRDSFAHFTEADLRDFRLLEQKNGAWLVAYIRFRMKGASMRAVMSYCSAVVDSGEPVEDWIRRGRDKL